MYAIIHQNCIIRHLYTHAILKKSVWIFFFFLLFLFCSLIRTKYKKTWFLYVISDKGFIELSAAKQLNKIRNTCKFCDLLEM